MNCKEAFEKAIRTNKRIRHPAYMGGMWLKPITPIYGDLEERKLLQKNIKTFIDAIPIMYADDSWEVEEMWYEGDFKAKYPNGVLCLVSTGIRGNTYMTCIVDYKYDVFVDDSGIHYENATPVKSEDAPAIIGD